MTDPVFEIIQKNTDKNQRETNIFKSYNEFLNEFVTKSYGLYTETFIRKIIHEGSKTYNFLYKFDLRKILREIVRKMILSDLQIVFLAYFVNLHCWNINHPTILAHSQNVKMTWVRKQETNDNCLRLFLVLVSYFVKSYISAIPEVEAVTKHLNSQCQIFTEIYNQWIETSPKQNFIISPRSLNTIYSQFSKNDNLTDRNKDYNSIVNKILELSTPYSMMPSQNPQKKIKKNEIKQKTIITIQPKVDLQKSIENSSIELNKISSQKSGSNINNEYVHQKNRINLKNRIKSRNSESNNVNEVVNDFFKQNTSGVVEEIKPEIIPKDSSSAFFSISSSRYSALPINFRTNSNIFGSRLF